MKKPILKIDFVDFGGIDKNHNEFTRVLQLDFDVVISDKPDLLFFHDGSHVNRLYTCKKVFFSGETIMPDWRHTDYALTCHYLDDKRHLRYPYYLWGAPGTTAQTIIKPDGFVDRVVSQNRDSCSAIISNANPKRTKTRLEFFHKLRDRINLASGGRYENNAGHIGSLEEKLEFLAKFKLHFCYENKELDGYTTEKLVHAMHAGCIPIYWGNKRVGDEFNKKSMLCRYDFDSDEALLEKITEVLQDEELYREILSEPYFNNNTPNEYFDDGRLRAFFRRIIEDETPPISKRQNRGIWGRWTLAKRHHR